MEKLSRVVYTTTATVAHDRALSASGLLDIPLAMPKEIGGDGKGVNPEELFGAGYATCFLAAMKFVAGKEKLAFPADAAITATVSFGPLSHGFGFAIELKISLPSMDANVAHDLIEKGHLVCPFSNATRGNIEVVLTLV